MNPKKWLRKIIPVSNRAFDRKAEELTSRLDQLDAKLDALHHDKAAKQRAYYLVAEPGYPNYGDELIAREWLKYLAKIAPDTPVYLDCTRPGPAAAILRNYHPHLRVVDTLSRLTFENKYVAEGDAGNITGITDFIEQAFEDEGAAARYSSGLQLIKSEVEGVHFLGGGYMNGRWIPNLARLELGRWCHHHSIPVIATGVGLMPMIEKTATYTRQVAQNFNHFSVRDQESFDMLTRDNEGAGNIELMPDDCFINGLADSYVSESDQPFLPDTMVCIQTDLVTDPDAIYHHVLETLKVWNIGRNDPIGVVECNPYVDYPIVEVLKNQGYTVQFFPTAFLLEQGFPARPGQRWLTTRFHPHILAAACGARGSFITVDDRYYGVKHAAVLRMGSRWSHAVLGKDIPQPGEGFSDATSPDRYSEQIRANVRDFYKI